jgi:hypothetical protein
VVWNATTGTGTVAFVPTDRRPACIFVVGDVKWRNLRGTSVGSCVITDLARNSATGGDPRLVDVSIAMSSDLNHVFLGDIQGQVIYTRAGTNGVP